MKKLLVAALAAITLLVPSSGQAATFKPLDNYPDALVLEGMIEEGDADRLLAAMEAQRAGGTPVVGGQVAEGVKLAFRWADFVPVTVAAVIIDGDTIAIGHERVRLIGIDTPETFRSRCENELVLGLKAKQRLRELLNGGEVRIERDGQDRYRRTLAKVFVWNDDHKTVDVNETLVKEGFALRYEPGADAKRARLQTW